MKIKITLYMLLLNITAVWDMWAGINHKCHSLWS